MISLLVCLVILWACFGAGAAALRRCRAEADGWAEGMAFAVPMGMGMLSYLMLAAGLLGCLRVWVGIALVCLLGLIGWRDVLRLARSIPAGVRRASSWGWGALPALLFFVPAALFTLIGALAPSADLDYDGLVYHLTIPKIYLASGSIHSISWLSHSNFPFTLEMLYLLGLLLRDQCLAKLFHYSFGWLTVVAIFAFGRRWWSARAGWLGGALFAAIPLVAWQMTCAYNELAFALYAFLAVYALARWLEAKRKDSGDGWLWVSAIMCGLAMGVKMLAASVLLFAVAALAWAIVRGALRPRMAWRVLIFGAVALALASPWYIKSYCWTGNPVYPFFYQIFDGRYWSLARAQKYTAAQKDFGFVAAERLLGPTAARRALGPPVAPLQFALLPRNLTMRSRWFFDQPDRLRLFNILIAVFGPLLLALLPALPLLGPVGGPGRLLLWFALCYVAIWFLLTQNGRYLLPALPGLCACAGLAAARLLDRRWRLAPVALAALLLGLVSGLAPSALLAAPAVSVVAGRESRSAYLMRTSTVYPMLDTVNRATPPEARVLVLGDEPYDPCMFYLDRDFLLGNHAEIFTEDDLASASSLYHVLGRMGVTHLLLPFADPHDGRAQAGVIELRLSELAAAGRIRVLRYDSRWPLTLWEIADAGNEEPR